MRCIEKRGDWFRTDNMGKDTKIISSNCNDDNVEELLNRVIETTVLPYINQIRETGLRKQLQLRLPGIDIDRQFISLIKKHLEPVREIELGKGIGRATVSYRNGKILIKPSGTFGLFVNEIAVTNTQIIEAIDNLIEQIQVNYIDDLTFIKTKISEIIRSLSDTGLYKPRTSEEKTLYDVVLLILLNFDYKKEKSIPEWITVALDNLEKDDIVNSLLLTMMNQVSLIAIAISENVYIDLKRTLDSRIVRVTLSKKTNNGQLSRLLNLFGIDIKARIEEFTNEYMSPSFVKGAGEIMVNVASSLLYDIKDDEIDISESMDSRIEPFDITITLGKVPETSRAIRWYTSAKVKDGFVQISKSRDFSDCSTIKADYEYVFNPKTVYDLGPLSKYTVVRVSKFSALIENLSPDTEYFYRIGSKEKNTWSELSSFKVSSNSDEFSFIVLADSQGMVRSNYDLFNETFKTAAHKFPGAHFVSHLGDFVDDGNNEDYWEWLLNNPVWKENAVIPVAGNHEARVSTVVLQSGAENCITCHFNVQNVPRQNVSGGIYYSFEYKNATFIVLNTNDLNEENRLSTKQYNWALNVAKNAKTKWTIAFMHKSPYSNGPHHDDEDVSSMRDQLVDFCREARIDFVIAGHDHVYVRTPALIDDVVPDYKETIIKKDGIRYEMAINPKGTIFIVPGTSGAKNYAQDRSIIIPSKIMDQPNCPIYSSVKLTKDRLYFLAYKYDPKSKESILLDSYAIEKNDNIDNGSKKLETPDSDNKIAVAYRNINRLSKVIVKNRREFIRALKNNTVGTIVTQGDDIKIETTLGRKLTQEVKRDVLICGSSTLYNLRLKVRNGAVLILKDTVGIDNTRRLGSWYRAANCIELYENSNLVLEDNTSLRTEYGIGRSGYCVYMPEETSTAYFNSASEQWGSKGAINASCASSKIIINSGKYGSKHKNNSTITTNGRLIINDGKINDIQGLDKSVIHMNGGSIGSSGDLFPKVPVTIQNKMYLTAGKITTLVKDSIELSTEKARLYLQPIHEGAVNIDGNTPYLNKIQTDNYRDVHSLINDDVGEPHYQKHDMIFKTASKITSLENLVRSNPEEIPTYVGSYLKAKVPRGDYYIFARALYASDYKCIENIRCINGAKSYIYSDIKHIINHPIQKIYIDKVDPVCLNSSKEVKYQLSISTYPEDAFNDAVSFSVSDIDIATIDRNGLLTIKRPGKFKVTAVSASDDRLFCRREIEALGDISLTSHL